MLTIGLLFWILMVIWAVFGFYRGWITPPTPTTFHPVASELLLFILLLLLGGKVFGWPLQN